MNRVGKKTSFAALLALILCSSALTPSAHAALDASIGLESQAFLFQKNGFGESFFPSIGTRISASSEGRVFAFSGEGFARVFLSRGIPYYINAPEAWVGFAPGFLGDFNLSFGRKKLTWNRLDEEFKLGIWQPRFRWDPISPEDVGLLGFHGSYKAGAIQLNAFASPVFIPETGVPMNFENGAITSPSLFGMAAVSQASVLDQPTPVRYDLQIPSIPKILFNPSVSVRAKLGSATPAAPFLASAEESTGPAVKQEGAWLSAGYAYKPINQILMQLNYNLHINASAPYILIPLQPRVAFHHVASFESGYETERWSLWASALGESPVRDETQPGWMTQEVGPSIAAAASLEWRFGRAYADSPRVRLSALQQWGGNLPDSNPPPMGGLGSSTSGSFFEQRYPYQTALQLQLWSPLPIVPRLYFNSRLLVDIGHDGLITSTGLTFRPTRHWTIGASADFLVTGLTRYTGDKPGDFIGQFHDNSRVQAGVSYVF